MCPTCSLHPHRDEQWMWLGVRRLWDRCYYCGTYLTAMYRVPGYVKPRVLHNKNYGKRRAA